MKQKQPKPVKAWAWAICDLDGKNPELCFWAEPTRGQALERSPGDEAKLIRVEIRPVPRRKAQKRKK